MKKKTKSQDRNANMVNKTNGGKTTGEISRAVVPGLMKLCRDERNVHPEPNQNQNNTKRTVRNLTQNISLHSLKSLGTNRPSRVCHIKKI